MSKLSGIVLLVLAIVCPRAAAATEVIRIGTLAPAQSPWGHVCSRSS